MLSILTSAAKALCGFSRRTDSQSVLRKLHWLPIKEKILYKLAVLGFKVVHGNAPECFSPIGFIVPARATRSASAPPSHLFLRNS